MELRTFKKLRQTCGLDQQPKSYFTYLLITGFTTEYKNVSVGGISPQPEVIFMSPLLVQYSQSLLNSRLLSQNVTMVYADTVERNEIIKRCTFHTF